MNAVLTIKTFLRSLYHQLLDKSQALQDLRSYYLDHIVPFIRQEISLKYFSLVLVLVLGLVGIRLLNKWKARGGLWPTILFLGQLVLVYGACSFTFLQFPKLLKPDYLHYIYIALSNLFIFNLFYKVYLLTHLYQRLLIKRIHLLDLTFIRFATVKRATHLFLVLIASLLRFLSYTVLILVYVFYLESNFKGLAALDLGKRLNGILLLMVLLTYRHSLKQAYDEVLKILRRLSPAYVSDFVLCRITLVRKDQFSYLLFSLLNGVLLSASLFLTLYLLHQAAILILLGGFEPLLKKVSLTALNLGFLYLLYRLLAWVRLTIHRQLHQTALFSRITKLYLNINKNSVFNAINFEPFIRTGLRVLDLISIALAIYTAAGVLLRIFPNTREFSTVIFGHITSPLWSMIQAIVGYVPNLFSIAIILLVSNYLMDFSKFFFNEIEDGNLTFNGFYKEFAQPTYKITRFLIIVLTVVIVFPYLPLSNSPAFKGISVFLGLLFSLGSSSFVANIVSGIMITYMRPFQIGDRVKIADTIGEVVEKNLLVTRIKTLKNVYIAIPNSLILSTHITNFSFKNTEVPIILHTTVTIGYDVEWKTVERLLLTAAKEVEGVLQTPEPFVLQTKLTDFYIEYELNAFTTRVDRMPTLYSRLHQQIQDRFNEASVEILSPHYRVQRSEP